MLIYLTNSLITDHPETATQIKKCVRNLCIAYEESKHLLLGDYDVIEWCASQLMDDTCQIVLNKLKNEYATSAIPSTITEYVEVGNWETKEKMEINGIIIHKVPFSFFTDSMCCQKADVIVEDENDFGFYIHVLKWYISGMRYNTSFKTVHGGGSLMGRTISTNLENERIALAFVDTDVRFPGDIIKENSTCDNCKKAQREVEDKSIFHLHILDLHEIENLLPLDIVTSLDWNQEDLRHFRYIMNADLNGSILRYFDIKRGITKNNELINNPAYLNFAEVCFTHNPELSNGLTFAEKIDNLAENGIVYPRLGRPLKKVIDYFNNNDITHSTFSLLPFQEIEWRNIGQNLLNFGIARTREALN